MKQQRPQTGKTFILRMDIDTDQTGFAEIAAVIGAAGGDIIAIDVIRTSGSKTTRDLTITLKDSESIGKVEDGLRSLAGVKVIHVSDRTFLLHLGGKLKMEPRQPIQNRDDLSHVYTPGVAKVCMAIHEEPTKAFDLTIKKNTVAVISDGSAVLGLGNIGPLAAMPVMEGKAVLFKQFAQIDAIPICLDTQDADKIVETICHLAPSFGGINLEDISSPRCFEIENRLKERLNIPVFHDDQHGTAVVMYAGLINALKLTGKKLDEIRVVVCGVGAAGIACSKILLSAGVTDLVGVDSKGIVSKNKQYDNPFKAWFAEHTNPRGLTGTLEDALRGADVFIGLSVGGLLTREHVKLMNENPILFAMANPTSEIMPEEVEDIAAVIATGRSDYPNQINNVLCFPGIFRGALDCRATMINEEMKLAAAEAIAACIPENELNKDYIIPSVFNEQVVQCVRKGVIRAAIKTGVAQKIPRDFQE